MRIQSVISSFKSLRRINQNQTRFERNLKNVYAQHAKNHKYTGNWNIDLAYASMVDNSIAKELKGMGLIV